MTRPGTSSGAHPGLYDRSAEHDSCGVACVARLDNKPIHEVIERSLAALDNLEHRGAKGADASTGDGAGILIQLPNEFIRYRAREFGLADEQLPPPGRMGIAVCFLPKNDTRRDQLQRLIEQTVGSEGQVPLGWRDVPVDESKAGESARRSAPRVRQLMIAAGDEVLDQEAFERKLFVIRRRIELAVGDQLSFPSFSSRTIVYKGMLSAPQLAEFYPDLRDTRLTSALAIVHSRFSTNTFPSWELAHPYRMLAHNGEINTVAGNVNWMRAREAALSSPAFGEDLRRCLPLIPIGASDSAALDRALELLVLAGRSIPHAMMMLVPPAYDRLPDMPEELADFYRYHERLMEPWDGPAAIAFSDGRTLGATLDRNGLRPGRWVITHDGWVAVSSEAGSFPVPDSLVARKGRLRPGHLFIVDLENGQVFNDRQVELELARSHPWGEWHHERSHDLADLPRATVPPPPSLPLRERQLAFGYSQEDLKVLMAPMVTTSKEPTGSMGADTALAVLSDRQPPLFSYFKQTFAQVTNPAIDSVRESVVMSLETVIGPHGNLLATELDDTHQIVAPQPILRNEELEKLRQIEHQGLQSATLDTTWPVADGQPGLEAALVRLCAEASRTIEHGADILILSDREMGPERVAIPSLLALSAVHNYLVHAGLRLRASLIVESGEPREVHHMAVLLGYGAAAINPYLMFESVEALGPEAADTPPEEALDHVIKAIGAGLLKVMSKMGISTIQSYAGAQRFEIVGLDQRLVDRHFTGTPSRVGGLELEGLAREALFRHARAYPQSHGSSLGSHVEQGLLPAAHEGLLPQGGIYAWRRDGERHMWDPATVSSLQRAARGNGDAAVHYEEFSRHVNDENASHGMLRGLMSLSDRERAVPIAEVEPAAEIVKRFCTGGMSLGALSPEAHETLAIAMNRIGGRSNSGEGGEDMRRFEADPNGDERRSAIHQVASGRFGVTAHYLVNADQLQIKISQGSKPGEGGQLPGHKVDEYIAELRHSTPGVELISPPPHHDIYSIEDIKQLIYDLRTANPTASVSVKLAAEFGVGTVAAGVVKAGADHIVIAGHDGGTGASPLSSIQSAGVPWEIGMAETQQTLVENDLRSRVCLQTDGQMRTGRDVVVAALLGADEVGFATAPLIVTGCIMMRVCHLNTCPVGVASQDPELRERFTGRPEHVVNYLIMVAEEARQIMAGLGVTQFKELIGRTELLEPDPAIDHWKAKGVDLRRLLTVPRPQGVRRFESAERPDRDELDPLDLVSSAKLAIERRERVEIDREVTNVMRAIGGLLSSEIARRHGPEGLDEDTIKLGLRGSAGQSLAAWLAPGVTIDLAGDANDYAGKGLSGGVLAIHPPADAGYNAEHSVIAGNVALYGATAGRAFFNGIVGERFAIRNSGAEAVVESVGDHGCEYMTGGRVVVLGHTGINFAAGMTGGIAYVYDPDERFEQHCNQQLVDLDQLEAGDREKLKQLTEEHLQRTGSAVAERLLGDWDRALSHFVKVIPRDYKRVLEERAAAAAGSVA
jgi:glutamate synthase domain-containing protein 2/glutamate synthase domain-containing protein 1/glutamate synthase domain-containing protein 3